MFDTDCLTCHHRYDHHHDGGCGVQGCSCTKTRDDLRREDAAG